MVREVLPRVHIYSLALIVSAFHRASSSKVSPVDCTRFDIAELEDYLSKVHPENLPAIDTMIGKFTSPVTELPFGALRSDWRRLLLLRRAQPEGSILREKLGRLFRILAVAYFQTNELSDITEQRVFSTTGSNWDCSTSERAINFEEDQEEAETLGTPLTDSTETNRLSESLTLTTLLSREGASRVSEIGVTVSDTTEPYDKRFDFSINPIDPSLITIRSSTFHTNTIVSSTTQSVENRNSIEENKSSEKAENLNHSALDRNNSTDNSVNSQIGEHIPKLISSAELSATEIEEKHINSSTNTIDTFVIDVTSLIIDTNNIVSSTTQSVENQNTIREDKSLEKVGNLNHSALDRNNSTDNSFKSQIGEHIPKLISSTELSATETEEKHINSSTNIVDTSVITVTATIFDVNTIARPTTESLANQNTIREDKSLENFENKEDDDKIDADSRFTTQEHPGINTLNITSSLLDITTITTIARSSAELSTTGATIERDKSLSNLGNWNNLELDNNDGLTNNKIDADSRFTTQGHPEINTFNITSSQLSTTVATIGRAKSITNLGKSNNLELDNDDDLTNNKIDADSQFTTQGHPEINTFNITSSQLSTTGATIERDKSMTNLGKSNNLELDNDDDLTNNKIDADSRFTTQGHPEINTFNITSSQLSTTGATIERDKSLSNLGKSNNLELDNNDDLANNKIDADSRFTTQGHPEINTFNITSSQLSTTGPTIERDKSLSNLGNWNNLELDNNDDLTNNKLDADSRFTTQGHPEINTFNITSSQLSTTGATIERDKSMTNLGKSNNLELDNDDDLTNNKIDADSRFTTQGHPEINTFNITSSQLSTTGATIERDKSLSNLGKSNNLELDNNDDLANNKIDADSRFTTQGHPEINTFNITSSQLSTTGPTIERDKSLSNLGNWNNLELDNNDDLTNNKLDADSRFTTQGHPEINTFNITSSQLSTTGATIERDKSRTNLGNLNNLELDNDDDLTNNKIDADSRFTTQGHPEINTFNITSSQLSTTGATIERDKSMTNLGKSNNLELDNDDDLTNNKIDADSRFTTQGHPEINTFNITSSQLSTTGATIERDKSLSNLGKSNNLELDNNDDLANNKIDADSRFTTQGHPEINTFNITSSQLSTTGPTIERDKSLSNLGNWNNLELDNNDDLTNNKLDADSRFTTQGHPEINTFNITSSQLSTTGATIERDKSRTNLGNLNNLELDNDDDLTNNKIDADSRFTTQGHPEINTFNITSSQLSTTGATIEREKSITNLGKSNNLELDNDDGLTNNKIDADSRFTTQGHSEINTFNITSSQLSTTGATIEREKSITNLGKSNNLELDKDDDLTNNKIDADSRFTTQGHPEINTFNITSSQLSTTGPTIERDKSMTDLGNLNNLELDNNDDLANNKIDADSRFTTQGHPEINTFNITSSLLNITSITTTARSSAESSTSRTIIEGDESSENLKVVPLESPVNKNQGKQMAEKEKTVGFVKDGSSDHFRGAEVATVAAAAAVGGFVASKSSVAGATVEEEDAQPITSPVSESDTPVTSLGSDFSATRIRGYGPGIMNVEPAERIKESGSVLPTSTEIAIARGRGDSPIVYTPMNSEDQENIAEYRGTANTSDPGMTDVKTMIEQSRIDRIRGNEVRDGFLGQELVPEQDGGSSTPRSIQNSVPYRDKIRKPSVSTEPKVDSGFSSYIVTPQIVASTARSASNRQDRVGDNWSRTGPIRSKKRGSLNTDVEKSYRWFYNAEKEGGRDSDQRGIQIECGENGHVHGK